MPNKIEELLDDICGNLIGGYHIKATENRNQIISEFKKLEEENEKLKIWKKEAHKHLEEVTYWETCPSSMKLEINDLLLG